MVIVMIIIIVVEVVLMEELEVMDVLEGEGCELLKMWPYNYYK